MRRPASDSEMIDASGKPLSSMTGYARASGGAEGMSFEIELKSVNGRGLDLRLRLPPGLRRASRPDIRQRARQAPVTRLGVAVAHRSTAKASAGEVVINQAGARCRPRRARASLQGQVEAAPPRLDGILALKGVLETAREPRCRPRRGGAVRDAILPALDAAIAGLVAPASRGGPAHRRRA